MTGEDNDAVQMDNSWSQDGDLPGCAQLDRRWVLWHEFMKEHAQLDGWLLSAEQVARASAPNSALVTYATGKEELAQFERLSRESACRLVQLDNLTSRNRVLTHMFDGAMRERLLTLGRDCGRRWDCLNARLDTVARRLKHFVSEWEEYETEREELSVLLSDLDRRLMEVEHLTGNSCDKMRKLQMFQMSVCANSARVNALLERGEALIQRSEATDAQDVERQLQDLLLLCSGVFHRIGRVHTRLLSMRLVFEDDTILSPDSGCPSEALLEDEGVLDIAALDRPTSTNLFDIAALDRPTSTNLFDIAALDRPTSTNVDLSRSGNSTPDPLPLHLSSSSPGPDLASAPPSPCLLTHDHLGLEWDPSVDIGRSMSREDADSSYFSAYTGLSSCREQRSASRSSLKRRSYLSSLGSQDAIPSSGQPAQADSDGSEPTTEAGVVNQVGGTRSTRVQWAASTPDEQVCEPISFDRGRVRAWLGDQSFIVSDRRRFHSAGVQTDWLAQAGVVTQEGGTLSTRVQWAASTPDEQVCQPISFDRGRVRAWLGDQSPIASDGRRFHSAGVQTNWLAQSKEHPGLEEVEVPELPKQQLRISKGSIAPWWPRPPALNYLLLAAALALALLACPLWALLQPDCHRANRLPPSFHWTLRYVNGPPPT